MKCPYLQLETVQEESCSTYMLFTNMDYETLAVSPKGLQSALQWNLIPGHPTGLTDHVIWPDVPALAGLTLLTFLLGSFSYWEEMCCEYFSRCEFLRAKMSSLCIPSPLGSHIHKIMHWFSNWRWKDMGWNRNIHSPDKFMRISKYCLGNAARIGKSPGHKSIGLPHRL